MEMFYLEESNQILHEILWGSESSWNLRYILIIKSYKNYVELYNYRNINLTHRDYALICMFWKILIFIFWDCCKH